MVSGGATIATGGVARFSLDAKGRVVGEDLPTVCEGLANCSQSGSTITLKPGEVTEMDLELTSLDELRQIGGSGTTLMFRRIKSSCPF